MCVSDDDTTLIEYYNTHEYIMTLAQVMGQ